MELAALISAIGGVKSLTQGGTTVTGSGRGKVYINPETGETYSAEDIGSMITNPNTAREVTTLIPKLKDYNAYISEKQKGREEEYKTGVGKLEDEYAKATSGLADYEKSLYDEYINITRPSAYNYLAAKGLAGSSVMGSTMAGLETKAAAEAKRGKYGVEQMLFGQKESIANRLANAMATGSVFDLNMMKGLKSDYATSTALKSAETTAAAQEQRNLFKDLAELALYSNFLGGKKGGTESVSLTGFPEYKVGSGLSDLTATQPGSDLGLDWTKFLTPTEG